VKTELDRDVRNGNPGRIRERKVRKAEDMGIQKG
jgi:hypothetical protein